MVVWRNTDHFNSALRYVSRKIRQNNWWLAYYLLRFVWLDYLERWMYFMFRLLIPRNY